MKVRRPRVTSPRGMVTGRTWYGSRLSSAEFGYDTIEERRVERDSPTRPVLPWERDNARQWAHQQAHRRIHTMIVWLPPDGVDLSTAAGLLVGPACCVSGLVGSAKPPQRCGIEGHQSARLEQGILNLPVLLLAFSLSSGRVDLVDDVVGHRQSGSLRDHVREVVAERDPKPVGVLLVDRPM